MNNHAVGGSGGLQHHEIEAVLRAYRELFDGTETGDLAARKYAYRDVAIRFYDLVTDFYQFGWGNSFHFAARHRGESFKESIRRCERNIAEKLELRPGMRALDVGCGVGGPLCVIAGYSGAAVTGVNNNAYQIAKAEENIAGAGLAPDCSVMKADFMAIPVPDRSFDAAYALDATPHAPDKVGIFQEIFRILKPGGCFAGFEWCLTDRFDAANEAHQWLKFGIEIGNGLPDIATTHEVNDAFKAVGFDILDLHDANQDCDPETRWYRSLQGRDFTPASIPRTPLGRMITAAATSAAETPRMIPPGTSEISKLLNAAEDDLVAAGIAGIFTPLFYFRVQRPHE